MDIKLARSLFMTEKAKKKRSGLLCQAVIRAAVNLLGN